jgi:metal-responsive CopG/Arc/MetJ family transcriptional regulator
MFEFQIQMPADLVAEIDAWAAAHNQTRSVAIQSMVEQFMQTITAKAEAEMKAGIHWTQN